MEFTKTRRVAARFEWRETSQSTNTELRELAQNDTLPHGTVVATSMQRAGRGRQGREWITPPGTALAVSVLLSAESLRPHPKAAGLGLSWVPLLTGSALVRTLQPLFPAGVRVGVKWPNDVHVRTEDEAEFGLVGQKLCGVLCEVLGDGSVIVGVGINLLVPEWELPTERATSVLVAGGSVGGAESILDPLGEDLADRVMAALVSELLGIVEAARDEPARTRTAVLRHSLTLGTEVRVHLPERRIVDGRATGLDEHGALVVELPTGGQLVVTAADVEHLR